MTYKKFTVFLGGTCNGSNWRDVLKMNLCVDYFDPVVDNWTPECQIEEQKQRENCDICLYVITPKMTGVYSIAEVIDDSNKRPEKTVFCMLKDDDGAVFSDFQWKSLGEVNKMIIRNGGKSFTSLKDVADYINF